MEKLTIPQGTALRCDNCGKEWEARKAIQAAKESGVRCPHCHSRYVKYAKTGAWVVPSRKKARAERILGKRPAPEPEPEDDEHPARIPATFTEDEEQEEGRSQRIARVRARLGGAIGEPQMMFPDAGELEQEEEPAKVQLATEFMSIDEIIDIETLESLHNMELEWLLKHYEVKKSTTHDKMIMGLAKKVQRCLQLILRDLTIPSALKILLVLYAAQQLALVMTVAAESTKKRKEEKKEEQ